MQVFKLPNVVNPNIRSSFSCPILLIHLGVVICPITQGYPVVDGGVTNNKLQIIDAGKESEYELTTRGT